MHPRSESSAYRIIVPLLAMIMGLSVALCRADEPSPAATLRNLIEQHEEESFTLEQQARVLEKNGLVPIWDRLNAASPTGRLDVLTNLGVESLTLGKESSRETFDLAIEETSYIEGGKTLDATEWNELVMQLRMEGYVITHSDWHQERFEVNTNGNPVTDTRFAIQGNRNGGQDRMEVKATARVTWQKDGDQFRPRQVEVLNGKIRRRSAEPSFVKELSIRLLSGTVQAQSTGVDYGGYFSIYDLNGDQFPEIILPCLNKILWNRGGTAFRVGQILAAAGQSPSTRTCLVADLNGDGILDWLCDSGGGSKLEFHPGLKNMDTNGAFAEAGIPIPFTAHALKNPTAITAGDIDRDGDLDLYVTQYRAPYESMPKEYWNANDGYGNALLINDGQGGFSDGTAAAGLTPKQFRRTYSSSFIDIDNDGDLDLVVVSDFCGTDLYLNDGEGKFTDVTDTDLDDPHTFGMSHTIADYDHDGRLDMFVTGMSSTTSRRLERMGAFPPGFDKVNEMRSVMGYGNRMYMAKPDQGFVEPKFRESVRNTGWSWGATSFDFDNDGDEDIYVGNGHVTGKTTEDYCTSFWCRDIYLLPGVEQAQMESYLESIPNLQNMSWDGYQANSLLVNQSGKGFQSFSYMLDVGFDYDTRQVVAADLDLDGRVDLVLTRQQADVIIYRNVLKEAAEREWIGVTLSGTPTVSPLGAVIELDTAQGMRRATVVSGDSYICQHPAQKHFGIEPGNKVKSITVVWPDGSRTVKQDPEPRHYYAMSPQAR